MLKVAIPPIPAAIRLYLAKVLPQLLYGTILGPSSSSFVSLERVQSKFLRSIFQVSSYVSNASLRLDSGLLKFKARIALASIYLWLNLNFNTQGLTSLVLIDNFQSTWLKAVQTELRHLGFSPEIVLAMDLIQARVTIKQRLRDIGGQEDVSRSPDFLASDDTRYIAAPATFIIRASWAEESFLPS